MIRARLNNGDWIVGIEERNVELLKEGRPMVIRLKEYDPKLPDICIVYGKTLEDVVKELRDFLALGEKMR